MIGSLVRLVLFLGFLPLLFIIQTTARAQDSGTGIPPNESRTLNKTLPSVKLVDHNGKVFDLHDLKGKPVIISPIYTHCESACPLITESLKKNVYKLGLPGRDFWVLSFTFDPEDTVEDLKRFRKEKAINDNGWLTVKAYTREDLFRLVDALDFRFMTIQETRDFVHPNLIVFVSPDMVLKRYVYGVVFNKDELERALKYANGEVEVLEVLRPYISCKTFLRLSSNTILKSAAKWEIFWKSRGVHPRVVKCQSRVQTPLGGE